MVDTQSQPAPLWRRGSMNLDLKQYTRSSCTANNWSCHIHTDIWIKLCKGLWPYALNMPLCRLKYSLVQKKKKKKKKNKKKKKKAIEASTRGRKMNIQELCQKINVIEQLFAPLGLQYVQVYSPDPFLEPCSYLDQYLSVWTCRQCHCLSKKKKKKKCWKTPHFCFQPIILLDLLINPGNLILVLTFFQG